MSIQEEKFNKRRLKSSYITTVVSISLVLFMLGLLGLIIMHAQKISNQVKENIGFSIIMKEAAKEADVIRFQKMLDASSFTKSTEYITSEQAAKNVSKNLGEDFISLLGNNPLTAQIDVRINAAYANNDSLEVIEKQMLKNEFVKEVYYQKSLVKLVNENIRKISLIFLSFSTLLLIVAIALINNTIRLSVYANRFLIKTMQLVGATQHFIRKPFIIKGIISGIIGAFLAIFFLTIVLYFAQQQLPDLVKFQEIDSYLVVFGIVIVLGIIFSWLSTFMAVRKYLNIKTDSLYY
ncbi:MAG: permease-like cell division protein FtsX [Bacteroidetes bacterium]|nr:permease-like cell division protein FtsX [Bacteroidota bacterium]